MHNYIAVVVLHLTRHEFYRMNPGLFYDMVQINNSRHASHEHGEEID